MDNTIDEIIDFYPEYVSNDSILVDYIDAFKLIELINKKLPDKSQANRGEKAEQFEVLKNQLTETSNPVLIILKNK